MRIYPACTRLIGASLIVIALVGMACSNPTRPGAIEGAAGPNTLSSAERAAGWRLLFDGKTTAGWRGYRQAAIPAGWQAVDGALTRVDGGGDIITIDQFANFELALEWQISPGGNSGIMYRVAESTDFTHLTGPEMQVLDNLGAPDPGATGTAGACYGLYAAVRDTTRPAGSWNAVRLIANRAHVEHWLNDVKVVEYELGSPDWLAKRDASPYRDVPTYGREPSGYIALQDHGNRVAFRSIKIRVIQ
jgi:3-keto-disaccharide hydrolase